MLKLLGSDPPTLDPHQTGDSTSARYILEVFGGLLTIDPDMAVAPDLAESWEISPDGRSYTFRLNPSATFHDGRKVTAADFQWSMERAADPATESPAVDTFLGDIVGTMDKLNGEADSISGISVIDNETLRLEIDAPKSYFLSKMTYPTTFVVDQANVETGREWVKSPQRHRPPSCWQTTNPGVLMRLERFDRYHLGPAMLDAVEFNLAGGRRAADVRERRASLGQSRCSGAGTVPRPRQPAARPASPGAAGVRHGLYRHERQRAALR